MSGQDSILTSLIGIAACSVIAAVPCSCVTGPDCGRISGIVEHVIDGDTIDLKDGRRIRMIGIDAPENGACWYAESRATTQSILERREVELEFVSRCTDDYGRLLAHVILDGTPVSVTLAGLGAVCAWNLEKDDPLADEVRDAARTAAMNGAGMWGACMAAECRSK